MCTRRAICSSLATAGSLIICIGVLGEALMDYDFVPLNSVASLQPFVPCDLLNVSDYIAKLLIR